MLLLKTIRDADFPDPPEYGKRFACRVVLFDGEGKVALLNVTKKGYHKLPGGGVEPGEDLEAVLRMEVAEQTGCMNANIRPFGTVEKYRNRPGIHQISHCFAADAAARKGTAALEAYKIEHRSRLERINLGSAIRAIEVRGRIVTWTVTSVPLSHAKIM
jgi:8-oxo-dGTP diphosphatase